VLNKKKQSITIRSNLQGRMSHLAPTQCQCHHSTFSVGNHVDKYLQLWKSIQRDDHLSVQFIVQYTTSIAIYITVIDRMPNFVRQLNEAYKTKLGLHHHHHHYFYLHCKQRGLKRPLLIYTYQVELPAKWNRDSVVVFFEVRTCRPTASEFDQRGLVTKRSTAIISKKT
jgi:hypothetical protein